MLSDSSSPCSRLQGIVFPFILHRLSGFFPISDPPSTLLEGFFLILFFFDAVCLSFQFKVKDQIFSSVLSFWFFFPQPFLHSPFYSAHHPVSRSSQPLLWRFPLEHFTVELHFLSLAVIPSLLSPPLACFNNVCPPLPEQEM